MPFNMKGKGVEIGQSKPPKNTKRRREIRSLSEEKQCNIQITNMEGMSKHVCTISGHLDNVLQVIAVLLKKEIEVNKQQLSVPSLNAVLLDVLKTHSASVNGENFAETKMKEKQASNNCIHLKVPDFIAASALEPKGRTLIEIQSYSGCRVRIS
ncbi:hypothetical protein GCK32_006745 [Trichostrongylus colubriformis]|uniref:Uncharacterized protein n=1 Tax=Trichostrongylus colubriformis TaxID=6319 RepID=A0AAN8F5L5_TRICO